MTATVHDRMPVILESNNYDLWLDPGMTNMDAACDVLKPYDARLMRCNPVSARVNHVANDDEARVNHVANDDEECSAPAEIVQAQSSLFF